MKYVLRKLGRKRSEFKRMKTDMKEREKGRRSWRIR